MTGLWLVISLLAGGQALTAAQIVEKSTARNAMGFNTGRATVRMVLQDKGGDRKIRTLDTRTLAAEGSRRRTLIRFQDPADVRGSAFLLIEGEQKGADDMYLYLPALKRTRRVAGAQRKGAFMGSDFSYADMESRDLKDAAYTRAEDEAVDGVPCHHVIATPKDTSQYGKVELWARTSDFLPQQIKFYGPSGDDLVKVYRLHEAKIIDGDPVITKSQMWTKATGHSTFLIIDRLDRQADLAPADFIPQSLATQ